ncbi:MAG: hypothetical protein SNJ71_06820, partial [Bacteroidales bacterium]
RYSYCRNNPLMYSDPNGNIPIITGIVAVVATWVAVDLLIFTSDFLNNGSAPDAWRKTLTYNYIVEPFFPNRTQKIPSERRFMEQQLDDIRQDPYYKKATPNYHEESELKNLAQDWFPELMSIINQAGIVIDFNYGYAGAGVWGNVDLKKNNVYKITINPKKVDKEYLLFMVLGHELYHIAQDITGKSDYYNDISKLEKGYALEIDAHEFTRDYISDKALQFFNMEAKLSIIKLSKDCLYEYDQLSKYDYGYYNY